MMPSHPRLSQFLKSCLLLSAAGLLIAAHVAIGATYFGDYTLGIGSIIPNDKRTRFMFFHSYWVTFGTAAIVLMASGLSLLGGIADLWQRLAALWEEASETSWVAVSALLTLLGAILIHYLVLNGAPMTDDEWSYRFTAQTLASGHLTANSLPEPLKLFFDRNQIINNGQWYSQYFIGWPVLAVPGVWLGIVEYMNAIYAAATIPPLYLVTRRLLNANAAKLAPILYIASPFLMVEAATLGSHTSCLMALAWTFYFYQRSTDSGSHWSWHVLLSLAFCMAFFVRPYSALAAGLPILMAWAWHVARDSEARLTHFAAFTLPALGLASLFLAVNTIQNGGPFQTAYGAYIEYINANDFRFTNFSTEADASRLANLRFEDFYRQFAMLGVGIFRLNSSLFGWPASLVLLVFAPLTRRTSVVWATLMSFLFFHMFAHDPGADAYGPVHFFEASLPVLLLSVAAVDRLLNFARTLTEHDRSEEESLSWLRYWPALAVSSALLLSSLGYHPVRLGTVAQMGDNISLPQRVVEAAGLEQAIVFAPRPYAPPCLIGPARHSVGFRPTNHPSLKESVLWVNHISVADNQRLMEYFPNRTGYVMLWRRKDCLPELLPLDTLRPNTAGLDGSVKGPDWDIAPAPHTFNPYQNRF